METVRTKVLIVEDDKEISRMMATFLQKQGYETVCAFHGAEALGMLTEQKDISLVLLDLMLPFQSGDMVLKKMREFSKIPVIVVSAKDTVTTKIDLLLLGADDYITKPFDLDELYVRCETVLRRYRVGVSAAKREPICYKALVLDGEAKTVTVCGKPLLLTAKEYRILEELLENPRKLFSKEDLYEIVWKEPYCGDDSTLKVHMSNLRNKLRELDPDEEYVETVWGMGFKRKD